MILTCQGPTQTVEYSCVREMSYEDMIISEKNQGKTETGEETLNQKFKSLIQDYIIKKTDKIVTLDNNELDIFKGKTD